MRYKYQEFIDKLAVEGFDMPQVYSPEMKDSYRFVFSNQPEKNHLPVCVSNPKRILPGPIKTSGYALSCFGTQAKAENRYKALSSSFKRISSAIGDSLANGCITNEDGMITSEDKTSHFDLYEFENCNLNKTFNITKSLI